MDTVSSRDSAETIWEQRSALAEAQAEIANLRHSLSALSGMGADLAEALQQRDQEYEILLAQVAALVEAPKVDPAELDALRAQLQASEIARTEAEDRARERFAALDDVQNKLAALRVVSDETLAAREVLEQRLIDREQSLGEIDRRLDAWKDQLQAIFGSPPETSPAESDARSSVVAKADVVAALVTATALRCEQREAELQAAANYLDSVQSQIAALEADKVTLEASLRGELDAALAGQARVEELLQAREADAGALEAQIDDWRAQLAALQADLAAQQADWETALAAQADAQAQLDARTGELSEINAQIDGLRDQLAGILTEDVEAPEALGVEDAGAVSAEGVTAGDAEVAEAETEPQKAVGITALSAGVGAAIAAHQRKAVQLADLQTHAGSLAAELQEGQAQLAALQGELAESQAAAASLQAELDATITAKAQAEEQVAVLEAELDTVNTELDALRQQLTDFLPEDALVEPVDEAGTSVAGGKVVKVAALGAGVTAAVAAQKRQAAALEEAQAKMAALESDLASALAGKLQVEEQFAATTLDFDSSKAEAENTIKSLQDELATALAARQEAEAALTVSQAESDDLDARLDALREQLAAFAPEDVSVAPDQAEAGGGKAIKVAALSAGVASAIAVQKHKSAELDAVQAELLRLRAESEGTTAAYAAQVAELTTTATASQQKMLEQETALAETGSVLAEANNALAAVQSQLDEATAAQFDLQATLAAREAELQAGIAELQGKIDAREEELTTLRARAALAAPFEDSVALGKLLEGLPEYKRAAANAAVVAGVRPYLTPDLQALEQIKGIGSTRQKRLYRAGVGSYWELSSLTDDQLRELLQLTELDLRRLEPAEARATARRFAEETGSAGRIWQSIPLEDFEPLAGIGSTFEQRLYLSGITTIEQLANASVEQLAESVRSTAVRPPDFSTWIAQAQQVLAERQQAAEAQAVETSVVETPVVETSPALDLEALEPPVTAREDIPDAPAA